jgi:hypothetical protein
MPRERAETQHVEVDEAVVTVSLEVPPSRRPSLPTTTASPAAPAAPSGPLPRTGADLGVLAVIALTLVLLGALALLLARIRLERSLA